MCFRVFTLTAILMTALHVSAFAVDSEIVTGGVLSGFLKSGTKYLITETIVVPEGKALVIEAGSVLEFNRGTGLDVRGGSLAVLGQSNNPVVFRAKDSLWNGVSITGAKKSEVQDLRVENAEYGFAVEKGSLELKSVTIDGSERIGIYAKNAFIDAQWVSVSKGKNIGVWASLEGKVKIASSNVEGNRIGIVATAGADMDVQSTIVRQNEIGVFIQEDPVFHQRGLAIEQNGVGLASRERPDPEFKKSVGDNEHKLLRKVSSVENSLGEEPVNPYAKEISLGMEDWGTSESSWKVYGNIAMDLGYHGVFMNHNHYDVEVFGEDTVRRGERFVNHFQTPGLFANWIANISMETPYGQTIDISADVSGDRWNQFNVHSFQAVYSDDFQRLTLGDVYSSAGDLYLAGVSAFGGSYELELFKNAAKAPLFEFLVFGGESVAPKLEGSRDPDMYNEYIDDGEAQAQGMIVGTKLRWNMHRRFNGSLGFIGSKDYQEDPFFRDGMSENRNTVNPLVSSRTFFADGNWLVYPGDIKLNGQVAVGAADTANSSVIHAINKVFADAGLDGSNFALLNKLMKNPSAVSSLTAEQLESIFGDNSMKTVSEMRNELRSLLAVAIAEAKAHKETDVRPSHANFWDYKNWAIAGSYEWSNDNTFIEGYFRYVGSGYFSAGSPDLLQNTRKYGGNLKQKITDFWKLNFGYEVNVENADDGNGGYNIFGLGEGKKWGLTGADDEWLEKHDQDQNRTLYIHDGYLGNDFKILDNLDLSVKYSINYRTRSTPLRLYSNYSAGSGIYSDKWFDARKGFATLDLISADGDTIKVDSTRWRKYYSLADEEFLASQFEEKLLKQTIELAVAYKFPKNLLKVGGVWVFRSDLSEFKNDDLLDGIDFSDETFGILGYYFHGGDYFEQRYPVSLTTTLDDVHNTVSLTPRYKIYNRDQMTEFEWNLAETVSFPIVKNFLEMTLNGNLRQNFLNRTVDGENMDEMELDVDGSAMLRVHHTASLYTDWTLGALYNYRPDNRADQYKDFYIIASLNYSF